MKKILLIAVVISLVASCSVLTKSGNEKAVRGADSNKASIVEPQKPAAGDIVVARWGSNGWMEGKVETLGGTKAKIKWLDDSAAEDVDLSEVFVIPKSGVGGAVKKGDYAIAKGRSENWWEEVEIAEAGGGVVKVKYINDGETANLPPDKVIAVTPAVAADIKDNAEKAAFLEKAHALRPSVPPNYKPKAGEHILGEWTTNAWHGGKIKSVSSDKVLIIWEDGLKPDEAVLDKIAPF